MKLVSRATFAFVTAALLTACADVTAPTGTDTFDAKISVVPAGADFAGKSAVQETFGWNARTLQNQAGNVTFRSAAATETVAEWSCVKTTVVTVVGGKDRTMNETRQLRNRSVTTTVTSFVSRPTTNGTVAVTGFLITGTASTKASTTTDGPEIGSCATAPAGFVRMGDVTTMNNELPSTGLEVRAAGTTWYTLLSLPAVIVTP